jgi:hypothetical protein
VRVAFVDDVAVEVEFQSGFRSVVGARVYQRAARTNASIRA